MNRDGRVMPDVRLLAAVSAGGVLGALARYGLQSVFPHPASAFGWATFGINVSGCLLIGIVVAVAAQSRRAPRLTRPFLGTGVLGGFTTFSTFVVDMQRALVAGAPRVALLSGALTLTAGLVAAWAGIRLAAFLFSRRASGRQTAGDRDAGARDAAAASGADPAVEGAV